MNKTKKHNIIFSLTFAFFIGITAVIFSFSSSKSVTANAEVDNSWLYGLDVEVEFPFNYYDGKFKTLLETQPTPGFDGLSFNFASLLPFPQDYYYDIYDSAHDYSGRPFNVSINGRGSFIEFYMTADGYIQISWDLLGDNGSVSYMYYFDIGEYVLFSYSADYFILPSDFGIISQSGISFMYGGETDSQQDLIAAILWDLCDYMFSFSYRFKLSDARQYWREIYNLEGFELGYNQGYAEGYNSGYVKGLADGYIIGENEGFDAGYSSGRGIGYTIGYEDGYATGYMVGRDSGINSTITTNWFSGLLSSFSNLLNIELFPNIKLWYLVGLPIVLGAIFLFLKIVRG